MITQPITPPASPGMRTEWSDPRPPHDPQPRSPGSDRSGYRADIQGLRAIAVMFVVLFHTGVLFRGGFIGVDVFFVISGFVITAMIVRALERDGRMSLLTFYSRRVRRLLPAVAVMVAAVALAAIFLLSPLGTQQLTAKTGVASSLFSSNLLLLRWGSYFGPLPDSNPLLHTWSLAVEEQFYLVFPAVLLSTWYFAVRVLHRSPRLVASMVLSLVAVGSFGVCLRMTRTIQPFAFYSSPTRAWEFAAGALLALALPALIRIPPRLASYLGAAGLVLLAFAAARITGGVVFPGALALVPVVGASCVITGGSATKGGVSRLLSLRPLLWIGDISYGWYLWHWPAIVFTRLLWNGNPIVSCAAALAALVPAHLSYRFVENPIRFSRRLRGRSLVALATACITVPVLACSTVWFAARSVPANIRSAFATGTDIAGGCANQSIPGGQNIQCSWGASESKGDVFLIGDSNARQFTEAVGKAAKSEGYSFSVSAVSSCPFVDLKAAYPGQEPAADRCTRFVRESVRHLKEQKPSLVIIASASTWYVSDSNRYFKSSAGEVARTPEPKAGLWSQGLASVVRDLSGAGIPTVVVHTIPEFLGFSLQNCPRFLLSRAAEACGRSLTRAQVEAQQRPARTAEEAAIEGLPLVSAVDFTDDLCDRTMCRTNRGAEWLYSDGGHLGASGALTLADDFGDLIRARAAPGSGSTAPGA